VEFRVLAAQAGFALSLLRLSQCSRMFARTLAGAQGVTSTLWSQPRPINGEATKPYYGLGGETNNAGQAVGCDTAHKLAGRQI
jgi:hypothetical protein